MRYEKLRLRKRHEEEGGGKEDGKEKDGKEEVIT